MYHNYFVTRSSKVYNFVMVIAINIVGSDILKATLQFPSTKLLKAANSSRPEVRRCNNNAIKNTGRYGAKK